MPLRPLAPPAAGLKTLRLTGWAIRPPGTDAARPGVGPLLWAAAACTACTAGTALFTAGESSASADKPPSTWNSSTLRSCSGGGGCSAPTPAITEARARHNPSCRMTSPPPPRLACLHAACQPAPQQPDSGWVCLEAAVLAAGAPSPCPSPDPSLLPPPSCQPLGPLPHASSLVPLSLPPPIFLTLPLPPSLTFECDSSHPSPPAAARRAPPTLHGLWLFHRELRLAAGSGQEGRGRQQPAGGNRQVRSGAAGG